ncbi:FAD-dependent oxidoreductase [Sphingomonas sp. MG17]|uniref:FAD-dependent oxidoreductase n=1 Tax=Sphingomonas tagetis TaxID=2949092 RepID=A0A9X2HNB1_9SPHN|nr:NAD(P)/FAD-dependent oxidoreductase [Sphingomonas tagetis]MCP3729515.1 FAD-dependent oxidoreductase [Sphingomonas tagetis]
MRGNETIWRALQLARRQDLAARGKAPARPGPSGIGRRALLQGMAAGGAAAGLPALPAAALPASGRVAIVGGGIAGLSALHHLSQAGVDARLYEARNRLGGRMYTQRTAEGQYFEAGGQLVNSDHDDIHALAKTFGVPLVDRKAGPHHSVVLVDGQLVPQAELVKLLTPLAARIARDSEAVDASSRAAAVIDNLSVKQYLDRHAALLPDPRIRRLIEASIRTEYGAEPDEASALQLIFNLPTVKGEHIEVLAGSDERYVISGGSGHLAAVIADKYRNRIETGRRLRSIRETGRGVALSFIDGTAAEADIVIVATPAPILRQIDFAVSLPARWRAFIAEADLGRNEKVQTTANATPWAGVLGSGGELWDASSGYSLGWDGTLQGVEAGGKPIWNWFLGGDQVAAASAKPDALAAALAQQAEPAVPGLSQAIAGGTVRRTNWCNEALTLGAYTNSAPGQLTRFGSLFWIESDTPAERQQAVAGRVIFAGEHVSDAWVGFMNGGAQTGRLAAEAVVAARRRRRAA